MIEREQDYAHPREREQMATYKVYFFGQFRVMHNSRPLGELDWRRNKAKTLFKWFLLNPGKLYSADQLIDLFWNDIELDAAIRNLHVTIHYLRHLLEPDLSPRHESSFLHRSSGNFYWFELHPSWWVDAMDIHYLYTMAKEFDQHHEYRKAIFRYRKIAHYCSLGFLPDDVDEGAFLPYRCQYECIYYLILVRLMEICLENDELEDVLEYAYQALHLDRYCETAVKNIAKVYHKQNNHLKAIDKLEEFQSTLKEELGIEPSKEMCAIKNVIEKRENILLL
ncbi:MAG TPA: BTAD domain-containing putative transcriptional regulator [Ktedonobacteraceae bacterium]|nr:BTAD domain-containing putative transcriptional regulator [Ktedonobacteraceae bacterium]